MERFALVFLTALWNKSALTNLQRLPWTQDPETRSRKNAIQLHNAMKNIHLTNLLVEVLIDS
jgi:hypothetical protein